MIFAVFSIVSYASVVCKIIEKIYHKLEPPYVPETPYVQYTPITSVPVEQEHNMHTTPEEKYNGDEHLW